MFGHNSGTPGSISTELGTHMAVYFERCCWEETAATLYQENQTLIYSNILLTLNKLNLYKQILILILTIITPLKTNTSTIQVSKSTCNQHRPPAFQSSYISTTPLRQQCLKSLGAFDGHFTNTFAVSSSGQFLCGLLSDEGSELLFRNTSKQQAMRSQWSTHNSSPIHRLSSGQVHATRPQS
jgi:hypothetical protein